MKILLKFLLLYYRLKFKLLNLISRKKAAAKAFELFVTPMAVKQKIQQELPDGAEQISFTLEHYTVKGYRWKRTEQGAKKVLILHGFSSNMMKFLHYVQPLLDAGMEVLAFDAPAHGESSGKTVNVLQYRDMIAKAVSLYGPVHYFIAHSFGGLALALYAEHTSLEFQSRLVLIAPATETTTSLKIFCSKLGISKTLQEAIETYIFEKSGMEPKDFSVRRAMHGIQASVLWIHDLEDDITPWKDANAVKQDQHPHVEFIQTSGLGHRKIYKDKEVVRKVIRFLSEKG